jgi:periplasmic protein TonB
MIDHTQVERQNRLRPGLAALRWSIAAAAVAAVHAGAVWILLNWRQAEPATSEPEAAVMIDLAPLPVSPPAPPQNSAPGPQAEEAQPDPTLDTPRPVEDVKPTPTPPTPTQNAVVATPKSTPEPPIPELPREDSVAAVLAPMPPRRPKNVEKSSAAREVERKKPVHPDKKKVMRTTAPPTSQATRSNEAAAPAAGASFQPSVSPATWKGALIAHLNRFKRYPAGDTGSGTATVAFTISRSGQVLSAHLIGSSGDAALDAEAVSLPRRASPVPAPPPGVGGGGAITLSVPVRFGH